MCTGEKTQLAVTEEAWVPVLPHSATNSSDLESVLHSPGLSILIYEERALQWDGGGGSSSTFFNLKVAHFLLCSKIQPQSFAKDFDIVQFGHFSSKINIVLLNEKADYNIKIILIMLKHSHTQISILNPIYKINTLNGSIMNKVYFHQCTLKIYIYF